MAEQQSAWDVLNGKVRQLLAEYGRVRGDCAELEKQKRAMLAEMYRLTQELKALRELRREARERLDGVLAGLEGGGVGPVADAAGERS